MRILVTGSGGQLGQALLSTTWPSSWVVEGLAHRSLNISDAEAVSRAVVTTGCDLVINAAAYTAVDLAEQESDRAQEINGLGAAILARACATAHATLIHVSTDYVFDGRKGAPYYEDDPTGPLNVYGRSKMAGEASVRAVLPQHIILRSSWIFSSIQSNFVRTMVRLLGTRSEVAVVNDQKGCPTAAGDLARVISAISLGLESGRKPWGTYHYCGTPAVSWYEFAEEISSVLQRRGWNQIARLRPISSAEYGSPAVRPANSQLDCTKIGRTFGIASADWRLELAAVVSALLVHSS